MPNTIPEFFELSKYHNPPAIERIMSLIWQLEDECEQQTWRDHNHPDEPNCPCLFCEHAGGLWYNLRAVEAAFEGAVYMFPALFRRWAARARESGDEQRALEMEQRAAEKEAEAGEPTPATQTAYAPHVIVLNQLAQAAHLETCPALLEASDEPVYAEKI